MAAVDEVREALLDKIKDKVDANPNVAALSALAEAYAWVVAPAQPHGSK